jgi:hypothetical protein
MVRELMPVLEAAGTTQERAAATLGASGWQAFWLVTFPGLRWGFIYGVTLTGLQRGRRPGAALSGPGAGDGAGPEARPAVGHERPAVAA